MKDLRMCVLIVFTTLGLLTVGAIAKAANPTIQLSPEQQKKLLPQPKLQLKQPLQLPPVASLATASLSIYQAPLETWCRNNSSGTATGRVSVQITFPRSTDMAAPYANLVVNTGAGEVRSRIRLGVDRFSASTPVLSFPAREVCSDRCVSVRLEPEGTQEGYLINTAERQACMN